MVCVCVHIQFMSYICMHKIVCTHNMYVRMYMCIVLFRSITPYAVDSVKKLKFSGYFVTRCGRDVHRELTGYYFPQDDTVSVYEMKQLAKKWVNTKFS